MALISDLCAIAVGLVAAVAALNAAAWLAFRWFPRLLVSENQRQHLEYLAKFSGPLEPYISEWFDIPIEEWPAFCAEYRKGETGANVYDDFVEFRHPATTGKYLNISPAGFRHGRDQGPWPVSPEFYNVFFFGGSTTLNVGPDWTSVPSYLQAFLNQQRATRKPVRVYNFGRGAYFSTQERILFEQLLLAGAVPDMAIFLDGANDFYFFHGRPATWGLFAEALDRHNREQYELIQNRRSARPKWARLSEFLRSLPLARAFDLLGDLARRRNPTPETVMYAPTEIEDDVLRAVARRWLDNKRQTEAVAHAFGVAPVFLWQPTPAYKYDLAHHIALNRFYGLGGHERAGQGYPLLLEAMGPPPDNFIWLADMQENVARPLYLDNMHYTAAMSREIAEAAGREMLARRLLTETETAPAG